VTTELKNFSKELLVVMMIHDAAQRAKAAANLYKQFSQVAQNYASASGGDQAQPTPPAAAPSSGDSTDASSPIGPIGSGAAPTTAGDPGGDPSGGGETTSAAAAPAATAPADAGPVGAATSAASAATGSVAATTSATAGAVAAGAATSSDHAAAETGDPAAASPTMAGATPSQAVALAAADSIAAPASPGLTLQGTVSSWRPDPIMDEIKTFAGAAEQVYKEAVAEVRAKHGDQSKLRGTAEEMANAKQVLTQAAKAVEGSAATATGYSPTGALLPQAPASTTSIVNLTA
jgi:hypothetical protein